MHHLADMPLPSASADPFFRLAVFVFDTVISSPTSSVRTQHLRNALQHIQHRQAPHLHAAIGLYLLSFLPLHMRSADVDVYDGAGRSFRMARQLGMDVVGQRRVDLGYHAPNLADIVSAQHPRAPARIERES